MKLLNGKDLSLYIKERHFQTIRALRQQGFVPRLAIFITTDNPVIETYVRLKKRYAEDIGADCEIIKTNIDKLSDEIQKANQDENITGIIIQLPLEDPSKTDHFVKLVSPKKDLDGLGSDQFFTPATPLAILWLLAGNNIDTKDKKIAINGAGKLVGKPLHKILSKNNHNVSLIDRSTIDKDILLKEADVIITATGDKHHLVSQNIKKGAAVVDAGVASEDGILHGDVDPRVREDRDDISITPLVGGVGPLTICALFENLIVATTNLKLQARQ